jgi:hypothetical protein
MDSRKKIKKDINSMDTTEVKRDDRQIRVFISSTFRDMQAKRDYLVKLNKNVNCVETAVWIN